jgi:hypothetical protein
MASMIVPPVPKTVSPMTIEMKGSTSSRWPRLIPYASSAMIAAMPGRAPPQVDSIGSHDLPGPGFASAARFRGIA